LVSHTQPPGIAGRIGCIHMKKRKIPDIDFLNDQEVIQSKTPKLGVLEELTTSWGEHIWAQTDTVPLIDESGEAIGVIVVSTMLLEENLIKMQ